MIGVKIISTTLLLILLLSTTVSALNIRYDPTNKGWELSESVVWKYDEEVTIKLDSGSKYPISPSERVETQKDVIIKVKSKGYYSIFPLTKKAFLYTKTSDYLDSICTITSTF